MWIFYMILIFGENSKHKRLLANYTNNYIHCGFDRFKGFVDTEKILKTYRT